MRTMETSPGSSNGLCELTRPLDDKRFDNMMDPGPAPVRELSRCDRAALEGHFLALDADDRRLRFGIPMGDAAVRSYVERIDCQRGALFGVFDDHLRLIGAAHLACADRH